MIRLAVAGGRKELERDYVWKPLDRLWREHEGLFVMHGDCPTGVDCLTAAWAEIRGVPCAGMRAAWARYGKPAGPMRNSWIIKFLMPEKLAAFRGGPGTADMVQVARNSGVEIIDLSGTGQWTLLPETKNLFSES